MPKKVPSARNKTLEVNKMKPFALSVRLLVLAVAVSPLSLAFAAQPRGAYVGVGIGNADADFSTHDGDQLFRDAFRAQGATFTPQTSSIENKDSHLYIFGGYRIFPWLSAEGGYVDLGSFDYTSRGTVFIPGQGVQQISTRLEMKSQGVAISALGNLPVSDFFEFHARAGFFVVNVDAKASGGIAGRPVNASDSGVSFSFQLGGGAAVNLGRHFSLSGDWVHYFQIDNNSDTNDGFDYNGYDVDVLRLSAIVRF
jgi:hypothetical protein